MFNAGLLKREPHLYLSRCVSDFVPRFHPLTRRARVAMALSKLSGDEQGILFVQLCNVLDPGIAVALASVSNELRTATRVPLQQLKADHKAAAALCRKLGMSCKQLREAKGLDKDGLLLPEAIAETGSHGKGGNRLIGEYGANALKSLARSHPEVMARHHPDLEVKPDGSVVRRECS